ncbi:D-apionate lactonase [Mangrovicella endophytica]|uniref:D-apionate lactonase n=1 Tax=Mangrovicella endophytica TaxID=2066697 RepID=UPI000C9E11F6|nr:hypothetical protein [Mangrovicella endophytica]
MDDRVRLYGTDEPPAAGRRLKAGALTCNLIAGNLRSIRYAGTEVIRAVGYIVRDRDWGTYDPDIADLSVDESDDGFTVRYRASCVSPGGVRLGYAATIKGEASGRLVFDVAAMPEGGDFETNRCGFCILHPIEGVAGRPVSVEHGDGTVEQTVFPDLIEPWQPFKDIAALGHEAAPGIVALCRMDGDVFEMEDQRAWSDASYKTYVRPLARPWPYSLPGGETNRQTVTLELQGSGTAAPVSAPAATSGRSDAAVEIGLGAAAGTMPDFGVLVAPEDAAAILKHPQPLQRLAPRHLLFHYDPLAGHGAAELKAFAAIQALLPGVRTMLECVVPGLGDPDEELAAAAAAVRSAGLRLDAVTVGPSVDRQSTPPGSQWPACPPLETVYAAARAAFPGVELGGGMFSYFTELNRKRPPLEPLGYVTHATCPIVHAADDQSVMQTLEAIPFITRSARAIIGDKPYHLGPTTVGMRQNPYGSRTMPNPDGRRIAMADDDPRQRGLFAAAWLVGYAARLEPDGPQSWTGAAMAGPRGLYAGEAAVVPAYHVARALAAASGANRTSVTSSDRRRIDGFAFARANGATELWLANLTAAPVGLRLPDGAWAMSRLDVSTFDAASAGDMPAADPIGSRLELPAYAVARMEQAG